MLKSMTIFALFLGLVALIVAPGCKVEPDKLSFLEDPSLTKEELQTAWDAQMQEWLLMPIGRESAISNAVEAFWECGGEAVLARPYRHRAKKGDGVWIVDVYGEMPDGSGGWIKRKARCEVPFERIDKDDIISHKNVTKFEFIEPEKEE